MTRSPYDVLDLKALRCFWSTARQGSLTRAGIELGISEAAVSQRLKSLEKHLGVKLYEARGGRFRLTAAGERTMEMALDLFDRLDRFETTIGDEQSLGTVSLATYEPVLRYLLPDVAEAFSAEFPHARLRLLNRTIAGTVERVRTNEVDAGIVPEGDLPKEVAFYPWRTYPSYVLLPRDHPLARSGPPAIPDLLTRDVVTRYPLVVPESDDTRDSRLADTLRREGLPYNVGLEVGTIESVKHYVARGLGIGVVTGLCLTDADRDALSIVEIPAGYGGASTYGVILRRAKYLSTPLRGLLSIIGVAFEDDA